MKNSQPTIGRVYYQDGKRFQLTRPMCVMTQVRGYNIDTEYATLYYDGTLVVKKRFSWDGASGPTLDTKATIRASCAHDVLYKLMRMGLIPRDEQHNADTTLRNLMKIDGAWAIRAWVWFIGLGGFGKASTDPKNKQKELVAP